MVGPAPPVEAPPEGLLPPLPLPVAPPPAVPPLPGVPAVAEPEPVGAAPLPVVLPAPGAFPAPLLLPLDPPVLGSFSATGTESGSRVVLRPPQPASTTKNSAPEPLSRNGKPRIPRI